MSDCSELVTSAKALTLATLNHLSEVLGQDTEERLKALSVRLINRTLRAQVHQGLMLLTWRVDDGYDDVPPALVGEVFRELQLAWIEFGPNAIPVLYLTARNGEITSREPW